MFGTVFTRFFLTSGCSEASTPLNAFDGALLAAGIGDTNLIRLSSILPPSAKEIARTVLPKGSFVPVAYGEMACSEPGTTISASVAVGIPEDDQAAGLIMECAREGEPAVCEELCRKMVREGMETIRGLRIREIKSVSASLTVKRVGAVFAAVVLCP
ncbi:MAG: arginine decarboxylase, pyruvoyl-dependent [Thermodesulfobacteriota bacterium]